MRLCRGAFWIFLPLTLSATDGNERLRGLQPTHANGVENHHGGFLQTFTRRLHNAIDDLLDMHDSQGES